eukprot:CAMPEP_0172467620 /NCGR_PEP_ID=MMETSP1065-20121228/59431_1 /TAXON_ID=265537 /ORGANISM="Amphiprora paludosa, Strain CCMP125" /LENGTH=58 /DNA_ID=CAMNT_0013224819 /DNA_START=54 /DNA_END=227 /DNA_ORIENTATION=-
MDFITLATETDTSTRFLLRHLTDVLGDDDNPLPTTSEEAVAAATVAANIDPASKPFLS